MNKLFNKIRENQYKLLGAPIKLGALVKIVLFTDAAFRNLDDGGSQGGQVLFLTDSYGKCKLATKMYKKIRTKYHSCRNNSNGLRSRIS